MTPVATAAAPVPVSAVAGFIGTPVAQCLFAPSAFHETDMANAAIKPTLLRILAAQPDIPASIDDPIACIKAGGAEQDRPLQSAPARETRMRLNAFMLLLALVLAGYGQRADAQDQSKTVDVDPGSLSVRTIPLIVGVGVHFGIGGEYGYSLPKTAELLNQLKLDSFRDDLPWSSFVASEPGELGREPAKLFNFMRGTGARPTLVIGHPNPAFPGGNPPLTAEGRAGFRDFAVAAVRATYKADPIYEVWNEWNMNAVTGKPFLVGRGDGSDPRSAVNYAPLASETVGEISKYFPKATVLVGAVGMDNGWKWTQAIAEMGALKGASGLSVHIYNHCERSIADRTAQEAIDRLYDLQKMMRPMNEGRDLPIYVTELGWPTIPKQCPISQQTAADNIAQFLLWSAATPWLKGAWIYEMKDQGTNPNGMEDNFGLYDYNYAPKIAACAAAKAVQIIKRSKSFRLERPFKDLFLLQVSTESGVKLVAWTSRETVKATLSLPADRTFKASKLCGDGEVAGQDVSIGPTPVVIDVTGTPAVSLRARLAQ